MGELRDELMDIFMEASAMKITPKQYTDQILEALKKRLPEKRDRNYTEHPEDIGWNSCLSEIEKELG